MTVRRGEMAPMHHILVITKFRYLGDTIVATPFLRALKEEYPEAEINLRRCAVRRAGLSGGQA